jgi:hypothetical protein
MNSQWPPIQYSPAPNLPVAAYVLFSERVNKVLALPSVLVNKLTERPPGVRFQFRTPTEDLT